MITRYTSPTIVLALLTLLLIALISVSLTLAQETAVTPIPTPTIPPEPVELTCDPAELLRQHEQLTALVATLSIETPPQAGLALDNLFKVGAAYQELALACGYIPPDAADRPVGEDVQRVLNTLSRVYGDPINGQLLYNGELGCAVCHEAGGGTVAPYTEGTFTRVDEIRLQDPLLSGYTAEQYLIESIIQPHSYIVPGYTAAMPTFYGQQITLQQLADVLAFLLSQDGPSPG